MAVNNEIILRKYEDFLLGKAPFTFKGPTDIEKIYKDKTIPENVKAETKRKIADIKEKEALVVVRYAITELLEWEPQEAMDSINEEIMKQLKLDKIITAIRYPRDLDKKKDFDWMVHMAFPNETHYDVGEHILKLYQMVKSGELKRFPKCVFESENGGKKLAILLNDYISRNFAVKSISDLYEIFGDRGRGNVLMHEANLYFAYRDLYETPLEYLHESLGDARDEFLFNFYQYMTAVTDLYNGNKRKSELKNI